MFKLLTNPQNKKKRARSRKPPIFASSARPVIILSRIKQLPRSPFDDTQL